jgi:hypothetical protein
MPRATCGSCGGMSPVARARMVATGEDPERGESPSPRCGAWSGRMPPVACSQERRRGAEAGEPGPQGAALALSRGQRVESQRCSTTAPRSVEVCSGHSRLQKMAASPCRCLASADCAAVRIRSSRQPLCCIAFSILVLHREAKRRASRVVPHPAVFSSLVRILRSTHLLLVHGVPQRSCQQASFTPRALRTRAQSSARQSPGSSQRDVPPP